MPSYPAYEKTLVKACGGYDRKTCWVHGRAGYLPPGPATGPQGLGVLTIQKLLLTGSDIFYGIHDLLSHDLGETWSAPRPQAGLERRMVTDEVVMAPCDFWPGYHRATGKLLGIGHSAFYKGERLARWYARRTIYSVYDVAAGTWADWRPMEMPDSRLFANAGAGCTQRVDLADGTILLPIYFRPGPEPGQTPPSAVTRVTVARCAFDGRDLRFLEHGNFLELPPNHGRGLGEPSLACWGGRYFLTLRNDLAAYISVSDDGLHYSAPKAWTFDDGSDLGSYNTQAHWVNHSQALHLVYTRRGANNDHVFRHRAPLFMAPIDPDRLCVIRAGEQPVVPERGARLGNFGTTQVNAEESWVTTCEWMQTAGPNPHDSTVCERYGSDNAVWVSRLRWQTPNALA